MISNTDLFYAKAKSFQDKRAVLVEKYEQEVKLLERFRGSVGYDQDMKKLKEVHEQEIESLCAEYRPGFRAIFDGMMDAIGKRTVTPPTTEQLNLLGLLKMKDKVTTEECERAAETLKDNPIALSVVTDIARKNGILRSFNDLCSEMSSATAEQIVREMRERIDDFLQYDTTRASRLARKYHDSRYGMSGGKPTKRPLFHEKSECFAQMAGLEGQKLRLFSEIVDR